MKKSCLSVLLIALMSMLIFCGCGSENNGIVNTASQTVSGNNSRASDINSLTPSANSDGAGEQSTVGFLGNLSKPETPSADIANMSLNVNNVDINVREALYCTDSGYSVFISGEKDGDYFFAALDMVNAFTADSSFSQSDFGNTMQITATVSRPDSQEVYSGVTPNTISNASVSINDISNGVMNVSISGTINTDAGDIPFKASGAVKSSTNAEIMNIINGYGDILGTNNGNGNSNGYGHDTDHNHGNGGNHQLCAGCKGNGKCQFCKGDGTCHSCFGGIDHCIDCGGTNVCTKCGGSGICKYCSGNCYIN